MTDQFKEGLANRVREAIAEQRVRDAAPALFEALENLHLKAVVGTDEERHEALNQAWAALALAKGEA